MSNYLFAGTATSIAESSLCDTVRETPRNICAKDGGDDSRLYGIVKV